MKEFQFVEFKKSKTSYEEIERALQEKSAAGWEVASMTVDLSADIRGRVLLLLEREIATPAP